VTDHSAPSYIRAGLTDKIAEWHLIQQSARDEFYHLNYYTRREVLRLIVLLESVRARPPC
jgi:hypothetical protein